MPPALGLNAAAAERAAPALALCVTVEDAAAPASGEAAEVVSCVPAATTGREVRFQVQLQLMAGTPFAEAGIELQHASMQVKCLE